MKSTILACSIAKGQREQRQRVKVKANQSQRLIENRMMKRK
jgi:hypothetical protein